MLQRHFATRDQDEVDFAAFGCWDGDPSTPWIEEAENYVRGWVLKEAAHVLALRDYSGELVSVSAFDERVIGVPLVQPIDHPGWHLQVVAIRRSDQRQGLSAQVFAHTFAAMRELDRERVLVTAYAHKEHQASLKACAAADLDPFREKDEHYWELLGEVPEAADLDNCV